MKTPIKVKDVKDIEKINQIVCKYDFDIWIHGVSGMADAKSILGMYVLKLNEPLALVIPDDVNYKALFKELGEYLEIG
ncbi:HPr family phosphocarrier protein [Paenibacillus hexagrammi]|uniref:HPr family phosphocarrier protein n=1 Tax=Paenibacillus hexagrammi TaxID=2908839 RepID=A0ABY3SEH9_9BACL|nr:HPr family phosphocarrier protein [Paenibacillus sp. YPD9-1]UJF32388.1 HPr family phosphocarrier protein [Paenibacillus sp. YPD9-1]